MPTEIKLLTPGEVATRLHVSLGTVYRWLRSGYLHGEKIGPRRWFVSEERLPK